MAPASTSASPAGSIACRAAHPPRRPAVNRLLAAQALMLASRSMKTTLTIRALAAALCLAGPPTTATAATVTCAPPAPDNAVVAPVLEILSPVFALFPQFRDILLNDVQQVCLADRLVGAKAYVETRDSRLVIVGDLPRGLAQAVLVHELRHVQQAATGVCLPQGLSMQENARAVFALEADATVASLVVAWTLRTQGDPDAWNALKTWPMQSDIADVFERAMQDTGDPAIAAARAFDQWHANHERRRAYYVNACLDYLDVQETTHSLPSYGTLNDGFFRALCFMPDGRAYRCVPPD
ncbi:hypothetical protein KUH32_09500 [Thalassococcus sp. CAU 1522]|uniref:DUF6782 domain-containing protein n=1 Tax=Thalassococcus arenae TaxID=2851652 RepID=A0ABS6N8S9_9RHOB|nr:DUF6782 family putative metallopeptidase [Thalassococcus arenae]MBV2360009.1 hypothetical protein [Thalassococcus arenae]